MASRVCVDVTVAPLSPQLAHSIVTLCNHLSRSLLRKAHLMPEEALVSVWRSGGAAIVSLTPGGSSRRLCCPLCHSASELPRPRCFPTLVPQHLSRQSQEQWAVGRASHNISQWLKTPGEWGGGAAEVAALSKRQLWKECASCGGLFPHCLLRGGHKLLSAKETNLLSCCAAISIANVQCCLYCEAGPAANRRGIPTSREAGGVFLPFLGLLLKMPHLGRPPDELL